MNDAANREPILAAITTEHFVMQSAIGTSVNEQQARASMYLVSVSGALVALGFMAQAEHFLLFVAVVLPVLFLSGLLTIFRLVDIGMESLQSTVTIARIHQYYRSLGKSAEAMFDKMHGRWPDGKTGSGQMNGKILGLLTTAASMIACVNAFIGASFVSLLLVNLLNAGLAISIATGIAFALGQVVAFYAYQARRIDLVIKFAKTAGFVVGDDGDGVGSKA